MWIQGKAVHFESTHVAFNGEERIIDFRLSPVYDTNGQLAYLVPEGYDITERTRAEESLRRQADFDKIVTRVLSRFARCTAPDVDDCIHSSLGEIADFSGADSVYTMLLNPEGTEYSATHNWVAPGYPNYLSEYQNIPIGTRPWSESKVLAGDIVNIAAIDNLPHEAEGERRVMEADGAKSELMVPLRGHGNNVFGCLGFRTFARPKIWDEKDLARIELIGEAIANILERRRAEESLERSENRYRRLVKNMHDIMYSISVTGEIRYVSPQIQRYGFTGSELVSQSIGTIIHPEDRSSVLSALRRAIVTGSQTMHTFRIVTKNGDIAWLEELGRAADREQGKVEGITGMLRDVSRRMKAEEERRKLEARLSHNQKMEAIGNLAGGIAHDFNNILAAILGYTDMAKAKLQPDSEIVRDLNRVTDSGKRAADLIKQILAFSRESLPERSLIHPAHIVLEAVDMLRATTPSTIDIHADIGEDIQSIQADPTQILQVLINLCTNSAHAMEETGGRITVTLHNRRIEADNDPDSLVNGDCVELVVSDTGPGIPSDALERIFEPYFTTKEVGKGTGIGLAVVHGIVKSHNGTIAAENKAGGGAVFRVILPAQSTPEEKTTSEQSLPTGDESILFVDDEPYLMDLGRLMLGRLGYTVTGQKSSRVALEVYRDDPGRFDLVITDQTMPHMTGVELARQLLAISPELPIILCTGFSPVVDQEKADSLGIKGFVHKPVVMDELARLVRNALDS